MYLSNHTHDKTTNKPIKARAKDLTGASSLIDFAFLLNRHFSIKDVKLPMSS
jgi:hypothetical protein